jgi:hypothetical protein
LNVNSASRAALADIRSRLVASPSLYRSAFFLQRLRHETLLDITPRTEIVIDGFQSSGNSFSLSAFELAQPRPVQVAGHVHSPGQLIRAARLGLPTLLLVRAPEPAALSLVSRWPYLTVEGALRRYVAFYAPLVPYVAGFVVASFDQVIGDFGEVTERVNSRFGTSFDCFVHDEDNARTVYHPDPDDPARVRRRALKEEAAAQLEHASLAPLRERATSVYEFFELKSHTA